VDRIGQTLLFTDTLEESGTHSAAQQGVQNVGRKSTLMSDRQGRHADADLHLLQRLLVTHVDPSLDFGRFLMKAVWTRLEGREFLLYQVHEPVVLQVPGDRDNHVVGNEEAPVIVEQDLLLKPLDRILGAENRLAQRMIFPEVLRENLMHEVVGIVLVHLDLFEDYSAFALQLSRIKNRIQYEVTQDVECLRQVFVEDLHVKADTFLCSERIHVAADGIYFARNLLRIPVLRSLEHHVFREVRNAVPLRILMTRTSFNPDTNGHRTHVRHLFRQDGQTIRENLAS